MDRQDLPEAGMLMVTGGPKGLFQLGDQGLVVVKFQPEHRVDATAGGKGLEC